MTKQILSLGRQSFRDLRESNCIYVDKTQHIYNIVMQSKMYFLSRPRRFGKSLILSTLKELFKGSRELFKNLWIEDKWNWTQQFPIIHISFSSVSYRNQGLEAGIRQYLLKLYKENQLDAAGETDISLLFSDAIKQLHDKHGKVVILIDEYDKPLIDYFEFQQLEQAKINQEVLAFFYSGLKDCDEYIRLLFITGVSKFTKVSLFSQKPVSYFPKYMFCISLWYICHSWWHFRFKIGWYNDVQLDCYAFGTTFFMVYTEGGLFFLLSLFSLKRLKLK
jgi:hypothetical protein